jgi:signal transduction histidine kinase
MQERAARIGAEVDIQSLPDQGTTVTLSLPAYPVTLGMVGIADLQKTELNALE